MPQNCSRSILISHEEVSQKRTACFSSTPFCWMVTLLSKGFKLYSQHTTQVLPPHSLQAPPALLLNPHCLPTAFCPSKPRAAHPPCKAGASTSTKQKKTMLKSLKHSKFQLRKRELSVANISKGKITACGNYRSADKPAICEEFKSPEATN